MSSTNNTPSPADPAVKAAEDHANMFSLLQTEFEVQLAKLIKEAGDRYPALNGEEKQTAMLNAWQRVMLAGVQSVDRPVKRKPIRVYIDGCFDIMHSGHYNAIRQAKMLADVLVAGVHSDEEIERNKGPPVMNNAERMATVEACKWVDEVVFDTPYDPSLELLDRLNCDFCVHGDDMSTTADGQDAYAKVKRAGRMKVIKRTEGISTTDLVGRLLLLTKSHHIADDVSLSPQLVTSASPHLTGRSGSPLPSLSIEAPALPPAAVVHAAGGVGRGSIDENKHYSSGVSNFLPTTWRISQFSNGRAPKPEDKVVYIDGAFDLFHIGHIQTLKKARTLGTFLYVGIHDDKTINQHRGRNFPIMNLHERVMNVLSCKFVDEVVIGAPWEVTKDLVKVLNISVVVSGTNTKLDPLRLQDEVDPYRAAKELGVYHEVEMSNSLCTDDVIQRIIENRLKYEKRNQSRSKKELAYIGQRTYVPEISNRDAPAS